VALTAITVGLLGIFFLLSSSMGLNRLVSERHIATYLAAEGIELVKNLIDANVIQKLPWNSGLGTDGDYEMDYDDSALVPFQNRFLQYDSTSGFYGYDSGGDTKYTRKITVTNRTPLGDQIQVNSIVTWEGKGDIGARTVNLEDRFFNWEP